jgi:uncharacterized protein (DUF2336 family)
MKDDLTVREIIQRGGGPKGLRAVAAIRISEKTVYSWFQNGIPERHWRWVRTACGVTAEQLHRANESLRAGLRPTQAAKAA